MTEPSHAARVVHEVLDELAGRGGFDHWWGSIDENVRAEVVEAAVRRVAWVNLLEHVMERAVEARREWWM